MSAYNQSTISDPELRDLFKAALLDGDETDALTETFIEMERKMVFTAEAAFVLPLLKEQELFSKLHHTAGSKLAATTGKLGMKWLLGGIGTACVTTGLVVYQLNSTKEPRPEKPAAAVLMSSPDSTANEQEDPIDTTTLVQQTPAFFTPVPVTKQSSEMEPLPLPVSDVISMRTDPPVPEGEAAPGGPSRKMVEITNTECTIAVYEPENEVPVDSVFHQVTRIVVSIEMADIHVVQGPAGEVRVNAEAMRSSVEQNGSLLEIGKTKRERKRGKKAFEETEGPESVFLTVPPGTELILRTASGNIDVDGVYGGESEFQCDFGDIHITNSRMKMTVVSANGDTEIENADGDLHITSSFGDVTLWNVKGKVTTQVSSGKTRAAILRGRIDIQSDFGDVDVENVQGDLAIQASSGNVELDSIYGVYCTVVSNFGNVDLTNVSGTTLLTVNSGNAEVTDLRGNLTIESSFGNMTVTNVTGELILNGNSGNIALRDLIGDIRAETQFGDLKISNSRGNAFLTVNSGSIETKNMELRDSLTVSIDFGDGKIGLKNTNQDLRYDLEATFGEVKINKGDMKLEKENGAIVTGNGGISVKGTTNSGSLIFN